MTLPAHLTALRDSGLLRVAQVEPELEYLFRHALVQDAAYASLLKADRRLLHQQIGEALEQLYAERLNEIAPRLAEHFEIAGDAVRAIRYALQAGATAAQVYAIPEALALYARALDLAQKAPTALTPEALRALWLQIGRLYELTSQYPQALRHYEALEHWAQQQGDQSLVLASLTERAKIYSTANPFFNIATAQTLLQRARTLAQTVHDQAAEARILWNLMLLGTLTAAPLAERQAYGEQALALARALNLREQLASVLHDLWYAYDFMQWQTAQAYVREAVTLWEELQNIPMLSEGLMRLALSEATAGHYDEAITVSQRAVHLAQTSQNLDAQANNLAMLGLIHHEGGAYGQALRAFQAAIHIGQPLNNVTSQTAGQAHLGWLYHELGDSVRGLALARAGYDFAREKFPVLLNWPRVVLTRLYLGTGDLARAQAELATLNRQTVRQSLNFVPPVYVHVALAEIELLWRTGDVQTALTHLAALQTELTTSNMVYGVTEICFWRGHLMQATGHHAEAREIWRATQTLFDQLQTRRFRWQMWAEWSQLEAAEGAIRTAQTLRVQAQTELQWVLAQLPTPELQASLRALPLAQSILGLSPA